MTQSARYDDGTPQQSWVMSSESDRGEGHTAALVPAAVTHPTPAKSGPNCSSRIVPLNLVCAPPFENIIGDDSTTPDFTHSLIMASLCCKRIMYFKKPS